MRPAFYDDPQYKQKQAENTRKYWKLGLFDFKRKPLIAKVCANPNCTSLFYVKPHDHKIFCSQSCSAIISNKGRYIQRNKQGTRKFPSCLACGNEVNRSIKVYCSNKCQCLHRYRLYIKDWEDGLTDGNIGIKVKFVSAHIKRFLAEKYNEKCSICGWNKINPVTRKVPLEIDHIDGNASNNKETNLRLICPNCHALTPFFRNLNRGHGRAWRQKQSNIV